MTEVRCRCGKPIPEADREKVCPACGSIVRDHYVTMTFGIETAVYPKTRARHRDGGSKVLREETQGWDFYKATGEWRIMRRLIDWAKDWYEESFKDPKTGKTIYDQAHRLSEHHGHGSAKNRQRNSRHNQTETLPRGRPTPRKP